MHAITVIGLGSMGSALARCLAQRGHAVCGWNRGAEKAATFAATTADIATVNVTGSLEEAVSRSRLVVVCIRSHEDTLALLAPLGPALAGKTICDLSTSGAAHAAPLARMLESAGAECLLGFINAYPGDIGNADTAILVAGNESAWSTWGDAIRSLGGASELVGTDVNRIGALYASLFTIRQGFMYGMFYGALACRAAGISMDTFTAHIPTSIKIVHDYFELFRRTVPPGDYENPEASLAIYANAQADVVSTLESLGAPTEFMALIHDRTRAALEAGHGDRELTCLAENMG